MPNDHLADARQTATETYDALAARHSNRARREWLAGEPWYLGDGIMEDLQALVHEGLLTGDAHVEMLP